MADDGLKRDKLFVEFEIIRNEAEDKVLRPEDAVNWAEKHKKSYLNSLLTWDNEIAGNLYRIDQVRGLIRVVVVESKEVSKPIRAYISKPTDRLKPGGGYTPTLEALADSRKQLIDEALNTILGMKNRYSYLPELASLFLQIEASVNSFKKVGQNEAV